MTLLSIIIPAFNEQANISAVVARTKAVLERLEVEWTITFVDDGSRDMTVERVREENAMDPRVGCVVLSRNFGKEIAIAAGLRAARGDAVIIMDADLQHPPETIVDFVAAWKNGAEVVLGQRIDPPDISKRRQLASNLFYPVFRAMAGMRLEAGTVDFVLLDRKAVDAMNRFGERARFTKGLFHWIGFRATTVPFECGARFAGTSTFNFTRLLRFAMDGIMSFSSVPLRIWSWIGAAISTGSILYSLYFVLHTLLFGSDVPGFPSLIVSITFLSGIQLLSLGVIGEYLARIYEEAKGRPLYLVREEIGQTASNITPLHERAA